MLIAKLLILFVLFDSIYKQHFHALNWRDKKASDRCTIMCALLKKLSLYISSHGEIQNLFICIYNPQAISTWTYTFRKFVFACLPCKTACICSNTLPAHPLANLNVHFSFPQGQERAKLNRTFNSCSLMSLKLVEPQFLRIEAFI